MKVKVNKYLGVCSEWERCNGLIRNLKIRVTMNNFISEHVKK
jgi:hypothetical protein